MLSHRKCHPISGCDVNAQGRIAGRGAQRLLHSSTSRVMASIRRECCSPLIAGSSHFFRHASAFSSLCVQCGIQSTHNKCCHINNCASSSSSSQIALASSSGDNDDNDDVGLPLFKLCNFGVWKGVELGRGYSGIVHRGVGVLLNDEESQIQDCRPMALKISKPKAIHLGHETFGMPGREFETLRYLFTQGVPVPRPLGLCISTDENGDGRTLLIMELVDGMTLREWINSRPGRVIHHAPTGRTLHSALTLDTAIERLEVAISLVEALQRLHPFGVFADLKPRNVMVGEKPCLLDEVGETIAYGTTANSAELNSPAGSGQRYGWPVTLVDIGGIVLRRDIMHAPPNNYSSSSSKTTTMMPSSTQHSPYLDAFEYVARLLFEKGVDCSKLSVCCCVRCLSPENFFWNGGVARNENNAPEGGVMFLSSTALESSGSAGGNNDDDDEQEGCCSPQFRQEETPTVKKRQQDYSEMKKQRRPGSTRRQAPQNDGDVLLHPLNHRHLLETTCSYVSPELAAVVVESDRRKGYLRTHFEPCLKERLRLAFILSDNNKKRAGENDDDEMATTEKKSLAAGKREAMVRGGHHHHHQCNSSSLMIVDQNEDRKESLMKWLECRNNDESSGGGGGLLVGSSSSSSLSSSSSSLQQPTEQERCCCPSRNDYQRTNNNNSGKRDRTSQLIKMETQQLLRDNNIIINDKNSNNASRGGGHNATTTKCDNHHHHHRNNNNNHHHIDNNNNHHHHRNNNNNNHHIDNNNNINATNLPRNVKCDYRRQTIKKQLLESSYEKLVEHLLEKRLLIAQPLGIAGGKGGCSVDGWLVPVGERSTVFSLGLILVELFGGVRTGLTGMCHLPVVKSWFSKEYAHEIVSGEEYQSALVAQYHNYRSSSSSSSQKEGEKEEGRETGHYDSSAAQPKRSEVSSLRKYDHRAVHGAAAAAAGGMMIAGSSVTKGTPKTDVKQKSKENSAARTVAASPSAKMQRVNDGRLLYSGPSQKVGDYEFRIALEWELPQIPLMSKSAESSSLLSPTGTDDSTDYYSDWACLCLDMVLLPSFSTLSNNNSNKVRRRKHSCNEQHPSIIASSSTTTSSSWCPFRTPSTTSCSECSNHRSSSEEEKSSPTKKMLSFKEVFRKTCFPREGLLSSSAAWSVSNHVAINTRLHIGELIDHVLDSCLSAEPTSRPTFIVLKRMLCSLKLLYWNLKFNKALTERLMACAQCVKRSSFDRMGYMTVECQNHRCNQPSVLLRTRSRLKGSRTRGHECWELHLVLSSSTDG